MCIYFMKKTPQEPKYYKWANMRQREKYEAFLKHFLQAG